MDKDEIRIKKANRGDLKNILTLQKIAFTENAERYNNYEIEPLTQTLDDLEDSWKNGTLFLKAMLGGEIIGSVRSYIKKWTCHIAKLIVAPDFQNRGVGSRLLLKIEELHKDIRHFELYTGNKDQKNIALYRKLGYREFRQTEIGHGVSFIHMEKDSETFI